VGPGRACVDSSYTAEPIACIFDVCANPSRAFHVDEAGAAVEPGTPCCTRCFSALLEAAPRQTHKPLFAMAGVGLGLDAPVQEIWSQGEGSQSCSHHVTTCSARSIPRVFQSKALATRPIPTCSINFDPAPAPNVPWFVPEPSCGHLQTGPSKSRLGIQCSRIASRANRHGVQDAERPPF